MQSSSNLDPSIQGVLPLIASRDDATNGLRALAKETGGRAGRRYRAIADRLERGELAASASVASAQMDSVASLTRFALLNRSRSEARGHVIAVSLLSWIYLLGSLAVGTFLLHTAAPFANMLMAAIGRRDFSSSEAENAIHFYVGLYLLGIALTVLLGILFLIRMLARSPVWIEWIWSNVPVIGPTLRANELAEMAESIYQSLAAGQNYALAFGSASQSSRSRQLSRWLLRSKQRIEAGESLHGVARDLPVKGEFISGVFGSLASNHTASSVVDMWRETSLRMHSLMMRRSYRVKTVLAPVMVVVSMLIACFAFVLSLGTLYRVLEMIAGLT
jgi:hypothetical protein